MAQAITNTVQSTNPLAGLLGLNPAPKAPSSAYGGLFNAPNVFGNTLNAKSTPQTTPAQSYTATPLFPSSQTQNSIVQPLKPAAPATTPAVSTATPAYNASTTVSSTAPTVGGVNSGGTLNPNYALQTGSSAPATSAVRGLFPDVLSSLAYTSAQNNQEIANRAKEISEKYAPKFEALQPLIRSTGGILTTGTSPVAGGNAAVVANVAANQANLVKQAQDAEMAQITPALTAQSQTQSGLSTAGNLAQPFPTAYGQTAFNPATGDFTGGGSLPPEVMQQYAQMAVSGNYTAIPSFITSNPVLNAQLNVAAKALNPNFNPVQATGASSILGGIPALDSAHTASVGIKNNIQNYLSANPQLNPSDLVAGNKLAQWLQSGQFGDPKYQTLGAYLSEYVSTLAPILGVGGDVTNLKTQIAQGMVNAAASGKSISEVLNNIDQLAANKIADIQSGALGGGSTVPNTAQTGTGGAIQVQAADGNNYSFYQDANGNWVAK